jgi:uncharacterized protein YbjT (DUF2867 family)
LSTGDQKTRNALVAGASGLVGHELIECLRSSGNYGRVHLLVRRPLGVAGGIFREHVVNFDRLEGLEAQIGRVDAAFCCLGTTMRQAGSQAAFRRVDHDYVVAFCRLATALGVQVLAVVSSLGADPESGNFYLRVKGETERDLAAAGPGSLIILRPSLLTGNRDEFRLGERIGGTVLSVLSPLMVGGLARIRPVGADQVATAMVRAVRDAPQGITTLESDEIRLLADRARKQASDTMPGMR